MEDGTLVAWLTQHAEGVEAALVAQGTGRAPARRVFMAEAEARAWVHQEAQQLGARVIWQTI